MLTDYAWRLKYTPEDGDLVKLFYIPALEDAERYDRLTGYFNAGALALAARGIEGLVRNGGRMRLVAGCALDPPEIEAIERGEALREQIEKHLATLPLAPPDVGAADALEMLAWMVARGHLDVKVAVPCDSGGKPVHDSAIFHEKTGIVEDRAGRPDRVDRQPQRDRRHARIESPNAQNTRQARVCDAVRLPRRMSHAACLSFSQYRVAGVQRLPVPDVPP